VYIYDTYIISFSTYRGLPVHLIQKFGTPRAVVILGKAISAQKSWRYGLQRSSSL